MAQQKKNRAIWYLGIIAILMTIGAGSSYVYHKYQENKRMSVAAERISNYLEEKYKKKFTLSNGNYVWATNSYTFDASPNDDSQFKFPAFINKAFDKGIGDFYKIAKNGREMKLFIKSHVDIIAPNNFFSAACDPITKEDQGNKMLTDVRLNMLTPDQMLSKYPGKIYMSTHISYAVDVTDNNKEQIFKGIFRLIEFLKQKKFGYIGVVIYFYPSNVLGGKMIKDVYGGAESQFENRYWTERRYSVAIGTNALPEIKIWQDVGNYFSKWDKKNKCWIKMKNDRTNNI